MSWRALAAAGESMVVITAAHGQGSGQLLSGILVQLAVWV